jgi:uncharacterized protein (TIGR02996 family)
MSHRQRRAAAPCPRLLRLSRSTKMCASGCRTQVSENPPMTDADFLQHILAHPDDDAPRLIYADWLEERGDPRGEFIRVQCELAAMHRYDPRRTDLEDRDNTLLKKHARRWAEPLLRYVKRLEFRRGFVERISVSADLFLDQARYLFEAAPIRHLHLGKPRDQMPRLVSCPYLAGIQVLSLVSGKLGSTRIAQLAASPHLHRVETLKLSSNDMGLSGLRALVASSDLPRLRRLEVNSNELDDAAIVEAVSCPRFDRIQHLNVCANDIGGEGWQALVNSPYTSALQTLDLGHTGPRAQGGNILAEAGHWKNLTRLGLRATGETDPSRVLAGPMLKQIRVLDLGHNGWAGFAASHFTTLLHSAPMANVHKLNLDMCRLRNEGASVLANSLAWPRLRNVSLRLNEISDAGVQALLAAPKPPHLRRLDLSDNLLGDTERLALDRYFGADVVETRNSTSTNSSDLEY